mgnify:CR=1 FL=1
MTTKTIRDIRLTSQNGKMLKTTYFSDGSKIVAIVPEKATDRLLAAVKTTPDFKVVETKKGQAGSISYAVLVGIVMLAWLLTGCVPEDDRCTRPGWHRYDDCYGEP